MITLAQATDNATREDTRRITENDPDYQALHATTVARLQRSVRQYAREVKRGDPGADTRFINRHIGLLRSAYQAAHHAGQKDYWPAVSSRTVQHRFIQPSDDQTNKRLTYYALGSVLKMAHEVPAYQAAQKTAALDEITLAAPTDVPPSFDNRTVLQGQIVWSGLQDGYSAAGASDSASPYAQLWWNLGDAKVHCQNCPDIALGSPYDPPWYGPGSNQLTQSPGDGQTECGAACKCSLSYDYPSGDALAQLGQAIQDKWNNWMPAGLDSEGNVLTQPVKPPSKGSTLTGTQKAALDEFRNASQMWDTVRRNLPPAPSLFGTQDLPQALMPAWNTLTDQQQATVKRIEQALGQWLNATSTLVPPPVFLPDVASELVKWLSNVAQADWPTPASMPDTQTGLQAWLDSVAKQDWPTPNVPNEEAEMQAWLDDVAKKLSEHAERESSILLYNPNHDAHGRFTYGAGAASTVAKGKGATRREGGKRVSNANAGKTMGYRITDTGGGREALNTLVGHELTDDEIGSLVGAQKGDILEIQNNPGYRGDPRVSFILHSPDTLSEDEQDANPHGNTSNVWAARTLSRDDQGNLVMENEGFYAAHGGEGTGARYFAAEVNGLSAQGVSRIETNAMGSLADGEYNGYYTWARFGYQAPFNLNEDYGNPLWRNQAALDAAPANVRSARSLQGVVRTREGLNWWKTYGSQFGGTFSLRAGSTSRRALRGYLREKGIKMSEHFSLRFAESQDKSKKRPLGDIIEWTEDDDTAMDKAWSEIPASQHEDPIYPGTGIKHEKDDEAAK